MHISRSILYIVFGGRMSNELVDVFNEKKTVVDDLLFTDSRICGLAQILWRFDKDKVDKVVDFKNKTYSFSECVSKNSDTSLLVFKKDLDKYKEQNKYSLLILFYILNQTPVLSKYGKFTFDITRKDVIDKFKISSHNFTEKNYIDGLYRLLHLKVTYDYIKDGKNMRRIGSLVSSIDYDKEDYNGVVTVSLDRWCLDMFDSIPYKNNNFLKGSINYSEFISSKKERVECMSLPQKIAELYRINKNKCRTIERWYRNADYFTELLSRETRIQRRDIESAIKKVNSAIEPLGIRIYFDCDSIKSKFEKGNFVIREIKK